MILTTQMTEDYYLKAQSLLQSVKQFWHDRFVLGCIGFTPTNFTGEWFRVEHNDIPSYHPYYPVNRRGFVTMQNGDFAKYIDCADDEVIICVDADTIMQREFKKQDFTYINSKLKSNVLISVYPNNPPQSIMTVSHNLGCKWQDAANILQPVRYAGYVNEFTTSFMISTKHWYTKLASEYNALFDKLPLLTDHHAGNQWLFNIVCAAYRTEVMPAKYQCASWYTGFDTTVEDGLLKVDGEIVIFNHTKFNS